MPRGLQLLAISWQTVPILGIPVPGGWGGIPGRIAPDAVRSGIRAVSLLLGLCSTWTYPNLGIGRGDRPRILVLQADRYALNPSSGPSGCWPPTWQRGATPSAGGSPWYRRTSTGGRGARPWRCRGRCRRSGGVEPGEEGRRPVVARELQGGVRLGAGGNSGTRPTAGLRQLPDEGLGAGIRILHHRRDPGGRPKPHRPAPDRAGADARADHGPAALPARQHGARRGPPWPTRASTPVCGISPCCRQASGCPRRGCSSGCSVSSLASAGSWRGESRGAKPGGGARETRPGCTPPWCISAGTRNSSSPTRLACTYGTVWWSRGCEWGDTAEPAAGAGGGRRGNGGAAPPAGLQEGLARIPPGLSRIRSSRAASGVPPAAPCQAPCRRGRGRATATRAAHPRAGRERAAQPRGPGGRRRREWPGDGKRPWTGCKTRRGAGGPGGNGKRAARQRVRPAPSPRNGPMPGRGVHGLGHCNTVACDSIAVGG
jgi:hypothetical protein